VRLPGFVGGSYVSQSQTADAQRSVNLFPELDERGPDKRLVLVGTPGLALFATLPVGPVRALFCEDGRCFAVGGNAFCEILSSGVVIQRGGALAADGAPATICSNGKQLFITSGGSGYIFDLSTNGLFLITASGFPAAVAMGAFCDGYFVVLVKNSATFNISALFNGLQWDSLDFGTRSEGSDRLLALKVDHRELVLMGSHSTEIWNNQGDANFPFAPVPGSLIPQGIGAPASLTLFDNTFAWIGADERGHGIVYRANGYKPERFSDHSLDRAMQNYSTIADAEGWAYQQDGHDFLTFWFPTADTTWTFDAATQMWHERAWWGSGATTPGPPIPPPVFVGVPGVTPVVPSFHAHRARCHAFAFGQHLVGDRLLGSVYRQSPLVYDDAGVQIHRLRRAPPVRAEKSPLRQSVFELDMETGLGLTTGQGIDPQISLSFSDDGGGIYSSPQAVSAGAIGQRGTRVMWRRLGMSRTRNDRIYQVEMSDAVSWRLFDAYLTAGGA